MENKEKAERPRQKGNSEDTNHTAPVTNSIQHQAVNGKDVLSSFGGFMQPIRNYFPMPNEWINICAKIDNLAELKIVQYVLRHTWGYHEYDITKTISTDEFMYGRKRNDGSRIDNGTGLKSDRSVKDGIKAAIEHGYLICETDDTDLARIKKSYALNMAHPDENTEGYDLPPVVSTPPIGQVVSTHQTGSIYPSEVQHLPIEQVDTTHRSEKDTREKHLRKTLKKNSSGANASHRAQEVETFFLENVAEPEPLLQVSPLVAPASRIKPARARIVKEVKPKADLFADASPDVQGVIMEWQDIFKTPTPVTAKLVEHATTLAAYQPQPGEIMQCRLWMYQTDRNKWYSTHGMHLGDVARSFEQFRSLANVPDAGPDAKFVNGKPRKHLSSFDDPNYGQAQLEKEFYPVKPIIHRQEASYAESF